MGRRQTQISSFYESVSAERVVVTSTGANLVSVFQFPPSSRCCNVKHPTLDLSSQTRSACGLCLLRRNHLAPTTRNAWSLNLAHPQARLCPSLSVQTKRVIRFCVRCGMRLDDNPRGVILNPLVPQPHRIGQRGNTRSVTRVTSGGFAPGRSASCKAWHRKGVWGWV